MENCVIGLDFGTDSVRAVLVNATNGMTLSSHVHWYKRWKEGRYCDPSTNRFRQHPLDHLEGIQSTISAVIQSSQVNPLQVKGICVDTTGSSPLPLGGDGQPLCFHPDYAENPNAMVILWKDHTAVAEADEINALAKSWGGEDFTRYEGGIYSSEWFWAKILHIIRTDETIRRGAQSWMEHCDWITYNLVEATDIQSFKRSRCAAGHKAMWHEDWGGLPEDAFLEQLDPGLIKLKQNLYTKSYTSDQVAGHLSRDWATRLGLHENVVVAVGTFDAHAGAIGAEVEPSTLVRVMGTSTCDIIVSSPEAIANRTIKGICGQVDGSVIPGLIGLEAGQSAFGDLLAWFRDLVTWPIVAMSAELGLSMDQVEKAKDQLITKISEAAALLAPSSDDPIALDWINGRRTPDANQKLKAAFMNLSLGTGAPELFRALVEAICFGSKLIVERFQEEGIAVDTIVGIGGVAKKSPLIMQTLADVLQMPIKVARSEQAPALGAAMYAATAAGIYQTTEEAIRAMGNGFEQTYIPDERRRAFYELRYSKYKQLGAFVEQQTQQS